MGIEEDDDRIKVYIGNRDTVEHYTDESSGDRMIRTLEGKRCTTVVLAPGLTLMEAAHDITHPQGVWAAHSIGTPAWVASTDPDLARLLAGHWKCELREPDPDHQPSDPMYAVAAAGPTVEG